jgi:uncharacterized membrane protein
MLGINLYQTRLRSFVKTVSWRIIAFTVTIFIASFYLSDIHQSVELAAVGNSVGFVLYFIHERIWNKIKFGVQGNV